jgi:hypothetical protein
MHQIHEPEVEEAFEAVVVQHRYSKWNDLATANIYQGEIVRSVEMLTAFYIEDRHEVMLTFFIVSLL